MFRMIDTLHKAASWQLVIRATLLLLVTTHPSLAQDFEGVNTFLEAIVEAITGPIGVTISALAVIAVGFSFMTGRMDWTFAVSIIVGIAIVFGAATFVADISADGGGGGGGGA